MNKLPDWKRKLVMTCLKQGYSIRDSAKIAECNRNTIIRIKKERHFLLKVLTIATNGEP